VEYLCYIVTGGKLSVSTKNFKAVKEWPVPKTQREVRSFVQFCYFYATFIHRFCVLSAPLTDLLRRYHPQKMWMTLACLEAFETLKLRLISAPCMVLPEVSLDATFTVAKDASAVGIATVQLSYCKIMEVVFNQALTRHVD
jgi:hypothetical protein